MKTKICSNCIYWIYRYHNAGLCYGSCVNTESINEITQEDQNCLYFEEEAEEAVNEI